MDYRLYYFLLIVLAWHNNQAAGSLAIKARIEQACSSYFQNTPRAPHKLITCLQHFQKDNLPNRNTTLINLINQLYAADLMLLNDLSHISQKKADVRAPIIQLFPNNITAAGKKLYHEAELLIAGALQKL